MQNSPLPKQPTHQTVTLAIVNVMSAILLVFDILISVRDGINYPLSIISPIIALMGTIFISIVWFVVQMKLKQKGILWKVDGKLLRVRKLGNQYKVYIIALISILWIGPAINWFNNLPVFEPARNDEILIVITKFQLGENVPDSESYKKIKTAIENLRDELNLKNLRVEIETKSALDTDDFSKAQALGEKYNATIVIWGIETRVDLRVNFYNLKSLWTSAAKSSINKLILPDEYPKLIVQYLPSRINFLSLLTLSDVISSQGDNDEALVLINKAIASLGEVPVSEQENNSISEAYFRLGLILGKKREFQKSADAYSKAIDIYPYAAHTYNNRGLALMGLSDYSGAEHDFDKAIELAPDYPLAYNNRGNGRSRQNNYQGAIDDHTKAIELWPEYSNAYASRGQARFVMSEIDLALTDLNKSIELNPKNAVAYLIRSNIYKYQDEYDLALADLNKVIELNPFDGMAYYSRYEVFNQKGAYDKANADLHNADLLGYSEPYPYSQELQEP